MTKKDKLQKEIDKVCKKHNILSLEKADQQIWRKISLEKLSEDFLDKFKSKINWDKISCKSNLSEDFIRKYKNNVDWKYICSYQILSEDFIREFYDKIEKSNDYVKTWNDVCRRQIISEKFIREFKHVINWPALFENKKIKLSNNFIKEMIPFISISDKEGNYIPYKIECIINKENKLIEKQLEKVKSDTKIKESILVLEDLLEEKGIRNLLEFQVFKIKFIQ
jgi:hypothetical protein